MALLSLRRRTAPRVPPGTLVYAVGDVHGEIALLADLLEAIAEDVQGRGAGDVRLVLLGDLIDRGPAGASLLEGFAGFDHPGLTVVKGNHEAALLAACQGGESVLPFWLEHGAAPTLVGLGVPAAVIDDGDPTAILGALHRVVSPAVIAWLQRLPTSCTIGDYFFAHAGIRPGRALAKQRDEDLLWIRTAFLDSPRNHGKVVVHGHSIEPAAVRLRGNRIGLDTGAHEHGVLSAVGLQGDGQWLIQAHRHRRHAEQTRAFATIETLLTAILDTTAAGDAGGEAGGWMARLLTRGGSVTVAAAVGAALLGGIVWAGLTMLSPPPDPPMVATPRQEPPRPAAPVAAQARLEPPRIIRKTPERPTPPPARRQSPTAVSAIVPSADPSSPADPYAGRVARPLTGKALKEARVADADATRALNRRQAEGE